MKEHLDRLIDARPHTVRRCSYALSLGIGIAVLALLPDGMSLASRAALGWVVAAICLIVLIMGAMTRWTALTLSEQLTATSIGHGVFGVFLILGAGASIASTVWVLRVAAHEPPVSEVLHLLLGGVTVFATFFSVQCLFAVRYMHIYYEDLQAGRGRGLVFPGEREPLFWDFLYFAICAGMTFQVSDVMTQSLHFRKWVTFHGLLSFLFSTVNLALLVDIAANLIGD